MTDFCSNCFSWREDSSLMIDDERRRRAAAREKQTSFTDLLQENSSISIYQLIKDAFLFTAFQSNIPTILTCESEIFLRTFVAYLNRLNPHGDNRIYLKLLKQCFPWLLTVQISLFPSSSDRSVSNVNENLPLTLIWYLTFWLIFNETLKSDESPWQLFAQISREESLKKIYDSDLDGYSRVILSQRTSNVNGPLLVMFICADQRRFVLLIEGRSQTSLCLQISPEFVILQRGPSLLYWNLRQRSEGPLAIRVGHDRLSLDLNLENLHHPEGFSRLTHLQIYRFLVKRNLFL